jgi:hypothetical protein
MALKIFGSGGEGSFSGGLMGAGSGLLASGGNPLGALIGGLGGLFGSGDQKQETTYRYSSLTPEMRGARDSMATTAGSLAGRVGNANYYASMADRLRAVMDELARSEINQKFGQQSARQRAAAARSGGSLGTTQQVFDRAVASDSSRELIRALLGNRMGAEEIASGRRGQDIAAMGTATQGAVGIEGSRRLLSQTGVAEGNTMGDILGMGMNQLTDLGSMYNLREGGRTRDLLEYLKI